MLHASHYLNGKELCYLGTVNFTADVDLNKNTDHNSIIIPKDINATTCVFDKQLPDTQNARKLSKMPSKEPNCYNPRNTNNIKKPTKKKYR